MSKTITYKRNEMANLNPTQDRSLWYWRKQALEIFDRDASVDTIEIVRSGNKMDSSILARGSKYAPAGKYVIVASTGGAWGKSRRDFAPVTSALAR